MKRILFLVICISVFSLISCENYKAKKKIKADLSDVQFEDKDLNYDSIFALVPDYNAMLGILKDVRIGYSSKILLDSKSAEMFLTSKEVSFALGMFVADLAYVRYFEKVQLCTEYLESLKILTEKLAISNKNFESLVKKVETNIQDRDELFLVVDSLLGEANKIFTKSEQHSLSCLALSGFWLEISYLGLNSINVENIENNSDFFHSHFEILKLINQLYSCLEDESFINPLKQYFLELEAKGLENSELEEDILKIRSAYVK